MTEQEILQKLSGVFKEVFNDDAIVLRHDTTAEDIPGWDSLQHVTLVVATEGVFGVKFKTAELEELHNVGEFARLIADKLAARHA